MISVYQNSNTKKKIDSEKKNITKKSEKTGRNNKEQEYVVFEKENINKSECSGVDKNNLEQEPVII